MVARQLLHTKKVSPAIQQGIWRETMEDLSSQVREGMEVVTSDGVKLGKVAHIWYGTSVGKVATSDEETCLEVHRGLFGRTHLYLPCSAVGAVTGNTVQLTASDEMVGEHPSWHRKPNWIE
jgi:hypothetical protein